MYSMKITNFSLKRFGVMLLFLSFIHLLSAQEKQITGTIVEASNGMAIPGAAVLVKDTSRGVVSDIDGKFSINVNESDVIIVSYLGFEHQEIAVAGKTHITVELVSDVISFDEIIVIGYGQQRKGDLTGAITSVSAKDFNKGVVSSPEQLINGKVSGVQIMSGGGSPTAGSTIRIRGGASLNASNDPLIVLDGIPLESGGISGNGNNFMSLINPNDIESMTILKDASSTAIYGSRASNGVILITTKSGDAGKMRINFSSTNSVQVKTKLADMLSTQQFLDIVNEKGSDTQKSLLGTVNTNWNNEIYQLALGTDNNLSVSGNLKKVPYRLSVGYYNQDGILKTDNAERITGSLNVTPTFFDRHLKFNLGVKGAVNNNTFAPTGAIWNAAIYNPTIPVYSGNNDFGGFNEPLDGDAPVTSAVVNPVGLINQYSSKSQVGRLISNFDVDYKFYFLPELTFKATLGYDFAQGEGVVYVPASAAEYFSSGGRNYKYGPQEKENKLLTTFFNYNKDFDFLNSKIDVTAGYDYQSWKSTSVAYEEYNESQVSQKSLAASDQRHVLLSYYGRVNYAVDSRYMLTATIRQDGTSRFGADHRWGTFPSVAAAWRLSEESFLYDVDVLSNLKLRASFGITGQQEGIGNYGYLPVYTISQPGAQYIFGNNAINTYRPEAYVSDLKWETTKSFNYGLDVGFFNNRLNGSVEYYTRNTEDLLARVPSPAGTNFDKSILTNVGNVDSKGVEAEINATPIDNSDWTWGLSLNGTWLKQTVTNLSIIKGNTITNTSVGPTLDSYYFQVLTEGYAPNMFYVYHQLYDEKGNPIEGGYADISGDGEINSDDLYRYHSPAPDYILGFSTSVRYKNLTLGTSLRANIGNYVYNGMAMNTGALNTLSYNTKQLNNLNSSYLKTGFNSRQYLSDYYVENASFLKMDNVTLSYNFGKITKNVGLTATAMVQNVFTYTKYTGVDPEVPQGMDSSFYPRPRIFSVNIGLEF